MEIIIAFVVGLLIAPLVGIFIYLWQDALKEILSKNKLNENKTCNLPDFTRSFYD